MENRDNLVFIAGLPESVDEFPFHPDGSNGVWRENDNKPIAPFERRAYLVKPLLCRANVFLTEPNTNAVFTESPSQLPYEAPIPSRVGQEHFLGQP